MISIFAIAAYVVVACSVAVPVSRIAARRVSCHGENSSGYSWSSFTAQADCRRYCADGCWRDQDSVGFRESMLGIGSALVWPIALIPLLVMTVANRSRLPRSDRRTFRAERRRIALDAAIAKAEREAGIR